MQWYFILLIVIAGLALLAIIFVVFYAIIAKKFTEIIDVIANEDKSIDKALMLRYEELNSFVKVTKDFHDSKKDIFSKVIKLRPFDEKSSMHDKEVFTNDMLNLIEEFWNILILNREEIAEDKFLELYEKSLSLEENLLAAQRLYNANVTFYNLKIAKFPFSIVARFKGYKKKDFYEIEEFKTLKLEFDKNIKKN